MISQIALVRLTVITAATVTLLLILLNVKTAVEAGWDQDAQIRVGLVSRFLWTADSASVGRDTQVLAVIASVLNTVK